VPLRSREVSGDYVQPAKGNGSGSSRTSISTDVLETIRSQIPGADRDALKELPDLRDAPPAKREELFVAKLKLCSVIFSFDDPTADKRGKDIYETPNELFERQAIANRPSPLLIAVK
jgi:hypothetical protein